jgi:hypothetical protein
MSHHFDSPTAIQDGRINICDVYVFPGNPGHSVLVLTVNPDAGRSSPTSFRPEAVYEFVIGDVGGTKDGLCLRVLFSDPAPDGSQTLQVLAATDRLAADRGIGTEIGRGRTTGTDRLDFGSSTGTVWAGMAADPFWADGFALAGFLGAIAEGRYEPEIFDQHANVFDGRNVSAIVLEIPDQVIGTGTVSIWARITLYGHAPQRQVSRMGQPMLRPLFFNVPGEETEELNAGHPSSDNARYRGKIVGLAEAAGTLARVEDPPQHAGAVADGFLPDVLRYRPGTQAHFVPGSGNGRALDDDAFGIAVSTLVGHPLATSTAPFTISPTFPYLPTPHAGVLPALLELFGVRPAGADPTVAQAGAA